MAVPAGPHIRIQVGWLRAHVSVARGETRKAAADGSCCLGAAVAYKLGNYARRLFNGGFLDAGSTPAVSTILREKSNQ